MVLFSDPVDFLTISSDHAESTDLMPEEPQNEISKTSRSLENDQQGYKIFIPTSSHYLHPVFTFHCCYLQ